MFGYLTNQVYSRVQPPGEPPPGVPPEEIRNPLSDINAVRLISHFKAPKRHRIICESNGVKTRYSIANRTRFHLFTKLSVSCEEEACGSGMPRGQTVRCLTDILLFFVSSQVYTTFMTVSRNITSTKSSQTFLISTTHLMQSPAFMSWKAVLM